MLLGIVPGALTWALFAVAFAGLWFWLDDLARWVGRQLGGDSFLAGIIALAFGLAVVAGFLLLVVYAFVSVVSVVGQPFFEEISHRVDDRYGPVPPGPEWPWWRNAVRGIGEGLRLFAIQAPMSVGIFLIGLIPVVGTVTAWVLGALVGGWFVALELTSIPFERRGMVLRERRKALGARRARTVGFGAMAFVMAIVPPLAVLTLPAGVAAGTLLARRALDEDGPGARPGSEGASAPVADN